MEGAAAKHGIKKKQHERNTKEKEAKGVKKYVGWKNKIKRISLESDLVEEDSGKEGELEINYWKKGEQKKLGRWKMTKNSVLESGVEAS